jgi:hypothetical protein
MEGNKHKLWEQRGQVPRERQQRNQRRQRAAPDSTEQVKRRVKQLAVGH